MRKIILLLAALLCAACERNRISPELDRHRTQEVIAEAEQSRNLEAWRLYMELAREIRAGYQPDALRVLSRSVLLQALADEDPLVRRQVLGVLHYADGRFATSEGIRHLQHEDISVQTAAIDLLRRLGYPAAKEVLYPLLGRTDGVIATDRLHMHAAYAIARLHDKTLPIAPAITALSSPASDVRAMAASALGQIGSRDGIPALRHALDRDEAREVNRAAAVALIQLGERQAVNDFVLEAAESDQPDRIGWAIGMREAYAVGPEIGWIVERATYHPSPIVRARAAAALGSMRVRGARQRLNEMMESQLEMVAVASTAFALALINDFDNVHWIERAAELHPAELRIVGVRYLARLNPDEYAALFTRRLNDPDPRVRLAAVEALRRASPENALPGLGYAIGDEVDEIRYTAAAIADDMLADLEAAE